MIRVWILIISLTSMLSSVTLADEGLISAFLGKSPGFPLNSRRYQKDLAEHKPVQNIYFPDKHYDVKNLKIHINDWVKTDEKLKKVVILPGSYAAATVTALDLEFYDKYTGRFRYKLTIKPTVMLDTEFLVVSGPKRVPVLIKNMVFKSNHKPYMYLDGVAKIENLKLKIVNIHTSNDNDSFEFFTIDGDGEPATIVFKPIKTVEMILGVEKA